MTRLHLFMTFSVLLAAIVGIVTYEGSHALLINPENWWLPIIVALIASSFVFGLTFSLINYTKAQQDPLVRIINETTKIVHEFSSTGDPISTKELQRTLDQEIIRNVTEMSQSINGRGWRQAQKNIQEFNPRGQILNRIARILR